MSAATPVAGRALTLRRFEPGEEYALWKIYHSAVHETASSHYGERQLAAWAPDEYEPERWETRIRSLRPIVAVDAHGPVGFADVQPDGYIDMFFVAGGAARRGVGSALMRALEDEAATAGITRLFAHVSLNAQPFFARHGFELEAEQDIDVEGVFLRNARMVRRLALKPPSGALALDAGPGAATTRGSGALEVWVVGPDERGVLDRVAPDVFDGPLRSDSWGEFCASPSHHLAVAREQGLVVGMASAVHYVHPDKGRELFVNEVGVAPQARRRGIASQLLARLLAHGRTIGCAAAWVLVDPENYPARQVYRRFGGREGRPALMFELLLDADPDAELAADPAGDWG